MTAVKILLLLSAAALSVIRFISSKYYAVIPEHTRRVLLFVSIGLALLCVITGAVWAVDEKKRTKKQ